MNVKLFKSVNLKSYEVFIQFIRKHIASEDSGYIHESTWFMSKIGEQTIYQYIDILNIESLICISGDIDKEIIKPLQKYKLGNNAKQLKQAITFMGQTEMFFNS